MRRALLGLVGAVALGTVAVLLAGFIWPEGYPPDFVNLGPAEDYEPGSVTMHEGLVNFTEGRWNVAPSMLAARGLNTSDREVVIALARYEDGTFGALLARDPRNGCPMPWRPEFQYDGSVGWFRDPCHGSTYDAHGERVFGPSPRNMDYFDVEVNGGGDVIVDLRTLHEGGR